MRCLLLLLIAALPAMAEETFLVRFAGPAPADWSGEAKVEGGRIIALEGWQFDEGDSAGESSWTAKTKIEEFWYAPWERSLFGTKQQDKLSERGIVLTVEMDGPGKVTLQTPQGEASFRPAEATWARPFELGGGAVIISRVPRAQDIPQPGTDEDYPALLTTKAGAAVLAWQSHRDNRDQLWIRRGSERAEALTDAKRELFRVALAETNGELWAVWSEMRGGNWDLYARVFADGAWGPEQTVVSAPGSDIFHALAADEEGRLFLVWQSFRDGQGDIYLSVYDGKKWGKATKVSESAANDWEPTVAVHNGRAAITWDSYDDGDYDILMR
ncbi:MAG: exo-alpha-sialidase, partial [Bryobacterales bacterium]|nr:exo-alpha-sialidase [Bryobacterales bacterium]